MAHKSIDGIVVRMSDYGATDRYLSVLTASEGRFTLLAKGSRSMKSEQLPVSQMFTYCNYEYYTKGDLNILKGGSVIKSFYDIGKDVGAMALGCYLCDLACELSDEGEDAEELLRLLLNSLYALVEKRFPRDVIKAAFEFRAAAISGYAPTLDTCERCGSLREEMYLDVQGGVLICPACLKNSARHPQREEEGGATPLCLVSEAVLTALRYCMQAPVSRVFSFQLKEAADREAFARLCETYVLSHLERGFSTLDFYRTIADTPGL